MFWTGSSILPHLHQHSSAPATLTHHELVGFSLSGPQRACPPVLRSLAATGGMFSLGGWCVRMDFSKLGQNEKLAAYGAIAAIVGAVLAAAGTFGFGVG